MVSLAAVGFCIKSGTFAGKEYKAMAHLLGSTDSVLNNIVSELRDEEIQRDSMRFRRNLQRLGSLAAYEISRVLPYEERTVQTPLGVAQMRTCDESSLVVASILRAGLPLHEGVLNVFDGAGSAFISCFRKYRHDNTFRIELEHISGPSLEGKTLILCDAMVATGSSVVLAYEELCKRKGRPLHTHVLCAIAAREGLDYMQRNFLADEVTIWMAALDDALTAKAYIVPGLGDAGDLAYGGK